MASAATKITLRVALAALLLVAAFYVGRPLYWKLSATVHDIREKRHTLRQGISQIVLEAQKQVGWVHDESDSGTEFLNNQLQSTLAANRRMLLHS